MVNDHIDKNIAIKQLTVMSALLAEFAKKLTELAQVVHNLKWTGLYICYI